MTIEKQIGKKIYKIRNRKNDYCIRCGGTGKILLDCKHGLSESDCPACRTFNGKTKCHYMSSVIKGQNERTRKGV